MRHIFPLLILTVVFLGGFWIAANTPWVLNRYGARLLQSQVKDLEVNQLHVTRQRFLWSGQWVFEGVDLQCRYREKPYDLKASGIKIVGPLKSKKNKRTINIIVRAQEFKAEAVALDTAELNVTFPVSVFEDKVFIGGGTFQTKGIQYYRYTGEEVAFKFNVSPAQCQIQEASGRLYGGKFQNGQITFQRRPEFSYISWAELAGLEATQLTALNEAVFSGLQASLNGNFRLVGDEKRVDVFAVILSLSPGGSMSADLLERISRHLRNPIFRQKLTQLAGEGKPFVFDQATLYIQNADTATLALILGLESKARDIHIQERILVPLQGSLQNFLTRKSGQ